MKKLFLITAVVLLAFFTSSCQKGFDSGYSVKFEFTQGFHQLLHCRVALYDSNTHRSTVLADQYNIDKSPDFSLELGYSVMPEDEVHIELYTKTSRNRRVEGTASIYYNGQIIDRCQIVIYQCGGSWKHWMKVGDYENK